MKYKDFKYEIVENEVVITSYVGNGSYVVIPIEIEGYSVTSIDDYAFRNRISLTSVTIPNSVTSIGNYAFKYCSSLESITIPDSVTSIREGAFENCSSLTSITIGNGVTSIGNGAFENCSSLTSVTISDSVTSIGSGAFYNCSSLTSITIPDSVTSIGDRAFYKCSSLTSVTIPDSVTSIEYYAFENCSSLTSVTISDSVTSIGSYAFYGCSGIKTKIANYKAFRLDDGKLVCKDYVYKENTWSKELDEIKICEKGYHYCTNLFDIFNYYGGELDKDIAIYECEVGDKIKRIGGDSKCCTNKIKPVRRLYREDVIRILNGGE